MATKLTFSDTFGQWRDKINELTDDYNTLFGELNSPSAFGYNADLSSGLIVAVNGGRVRDGSIVYPLNTGTINFPANEITVLCIYIKNGVVAYRIYANDEVPERDVIPIGLFETNVTGVAAYEDLRTQYTTSAGSAGSASGVLIFDKDITENITVTADKNALSVAPTVADGVVVTVEDGAVWVVL